MAYVALELWPLPEGGGGALIPQNDKEHIPCALGKRK